jgi:hypothetical protein
MKKLLATVCSMLLALIVMDASQVVKSPTGLTVAQVGKGKAPIGKGKGPPPPVVTKG